MPYRNQVSIVSKLVTAFSGIFLAIAWPASPQAADEGILITLDNPPTSYRPFALKPVDNYQDNLVFSDDERELLKEAENAMNDVIEGIDELAEKLCNSPAWLDEQAKHLVGFQECLVEEYRLGEKSVILSQTIGIGYISSIFGSRSVAVRLYNRPDDTLGEAHVGIVDLALECSSDGSFGFSGNPGRFEIAINRYYLPEVTPLELAATVLHEIYHNLGHKHPRDSGRDRDWQIYALTDQLGQRWVRHSCFQRGSSMAMALP